MKTVLPSRTRSLTPFPSDSAPRQIDYSKPSKNQHVATSAVRHYMPCNSNEEAAIKHYVATPTIKHYMSCDGDKEEDGVKKYVVYSALFCALLCASSHND